MAEPLITQIALRNRFQIVELPLLARIQDAAERRFRRGLGRLIAKAARALFDAVHNHLGLPATGRLTLDSGDERVVTLRFDARNTHYRALARAGDVGYEAETLALLDALMPNDGVFFDIGANWGYFSLAIASRPGFSGTIEAFEPATAVHDDMAGLVRQAGLGDRIVCRGDALSDETGTGRLASGGRHSALARLVSERRGEIVTIARLDNLDLPAPDVIKIDVEGHEARVLVGAAKTIIRHRPMIVLESWYRPEAGEEAIAPLRLLGSWGYVLFRPLWRHDSPLGQYFSPTEPSAEGYATLALLPFDPVERLAFGGDFNVFACHADRLGVLHRIFHVDASAPSAHVANATSISRPE